LPEARIPLAQAAITVAASPKSNSCCAAIFKALSDVGSKDTGTIPPHIKNPVAEGLREMGYGEGYKYAHDYEGGYVMQEYLPEAMRGVKYYAPTGIGYEAKVRDWLARIRQGGKDA
ncbi:MAG: replication-associated recombination protein A, partial [Oscillospiraceae bacterium]|nr:replication-associated recombination protein A [Oscillospiraceae bacterium]